ncbi:unnamed protein product, partial [marine sediment metagenome]
NRKFVLSALMAVLLFFVTFSFPMGAYSQNAYASYPASEEDGLKFLATNVVLDNKTAYMGAATIAIAM